MLKKLLVLKGNRIPRKSFNADLFDRIIFTSDLKDEIRTNWIDKVKTLSQYEKELNFNFYGIKKAHNLIEQWKQIPVKLFQNKKLAEVLKYKAISILDVVHSDLQIYYLSRILGSIALVEKIIEYEKPNEIHINDISDHITKAFLIFGQAKGINVRGGGVKYCKIKFYSNEILPLIRFAKSYYKGILTKFKKRNLKQSKEHNKKPVIFLNFNHRNLDTALPVYRELEYRGINCLFIQHGNQGVEYLIKKNVYTRFFNEFNNFKINLLTYIASKKFIRMWRILSVDPNFQKYFIYHETNCWGIFSETLDMVFSSEAAEAIQKIELTKNMLNNLQPSAIVATGDRNSLIRNVFYCTRKNKTPSILLQYGNISSGGLWDSPITADIMCVESTKEKQLLENVDGNKGKVIQTGQPKHDEIRNRFLTSKKIKLLKKYNINNSKIVVFTSVPYYENIGGVDAILSKNEYIEFIECFYKATKKLSNVTFFIKPHPNENYDIHKEMIYSYGKNSNLNLMGKETDTFELIYISNLLITFHSTTGLEAVILDKPIITINITGRPDPADYAEKGVAIGVYKDKNLYNVINNALNDQEVRKFLSKARKNYVKDYLLDGKSSERIADVIESMAKA